MFKTGGRTMDLNYFKDMLFDTINESDILNVDDIISNDKEHTFIVMLDGCSYLLKCSEYKDKE